MSEFYTDNQLYLNFLQINEDDLPILEGKIQKIEFSKIVEARFRQLARVHHPDFGGKEEDFKFLVQCKKTLLEEENKEVGFKLSIDDSRLHMFDKTSQASQVGLQIFDLISSWADKLNIKPIFKPTASDDLYEWIFYSEELKEQIVLNVQNLSNDLLELSNDLYKDDSLSVLVCLFIPSKKLSVQTIAYNNTLSFTFNDKIFIESSKSSDIMDYFNDHTRMKIDIQNILNNTFVSKNNQELRTKTKKEITEKDSLLLSYLQNHKLFHTSYEESAADFLKNLPD